MPIIQSLPESILIRWMIKSIHDTLTFMSFRKIFLFEVFVRIHQSADNDCMPITVTLIIKLSLLTAFTLLGKLK